MVTATAADFIGARTEDGKLFISDGFNRVAFECLGDLLELGSMIECGLSPYWVKDNQGERWKVVLSGMQALFLSSTYGIVRVSKRELVEALSSLGGNFLMPP